MYLLDTQIVLDMFSRDQTRPVFQWLAEDPGNPKQIFVSIISLGQISNTIEDTPPVLRNNWRRLVQEGQRQLQDQGCLIDVTSEIVEVWQANLRGNRMVDIEGAEESLGEDDRLIIATAIARNYTLVSRDSRLLTEIGVRTTLATIFL